MTKREEIDEMKRLRKQGLSYAKIGKIFGINHMTIYNWLLHPPSFYRVMNDETKLIEMLTLFAEGHSANSLGRKYGLDHTTILYHVKKYKVIKGSAKELKKLPVAIKNKVTPPPPKPKLTKYDHIINAPVNAGKTYEEYLGTAGIKKVKQSHKLYIYFYEKRKL